MALVARMMAHEVIGRGGGRWEPCEADDPDAKDPAEVFSNHTYGVPFWLRDAPAIRQVEGQSQETFELSCVRSGGPDDPNNDWFTASPQGNLRITCDNPGGWDYVRPGGFYRVTIEKIRGPRDKERESLAHEAEQAARQ